MQPISFTARDGTQVHRYITIPRNSDGGNLPMIMHPHGGRTARAKLGLQPEVLLANRGYAVLQVNFAAPAATATRSNAGLQLGHHDDRRHDRWRRWA